MTGKCQASDIPANNPMAFSRAVMDEMSLPPLFPVGGSVGGGGSGQWLQM